MNKIRNYTLYVLDLEDDCFYVGMTSYKDVGRRFAEHIAGTAKWTTLHKPLKIHETRNVGVMAESSVAALETGLTLEYIGVYGIERVRGGALCSLDMRRLEKIYARCLRKLAV